MKPNSWKDTADIVGMAAIVASLIFVGLQLRQESAVAAREGSSDFVDTFVGMAQFFSDNREVWLKGLNEEPLTAEENFTFNALVRVFFIDRANRFRRQELGILATAPEYTPRYTAFYLYQYPGLRRAYELQMTKLELMSAAIDGPGASKFRVEVSRMLEKFETEPPDLPLKDYVVF